MDKTLVDLDNNLMLRSENIEYDGDSLKNKLDTVIESGSNENGNYIKFSDGTMICHKTKQGISNLSSWGTLFYEDINCGTWAMPFSELLNIQCTNNNLQFWCSIDNDSKNSCGTARLMRPDSNNQSYNLEILGIGKWK